VGQFETIAILIFRLKRLFFTFFAALRDAFFHAKHPSLSSTADTRIRPAKEAILSDLRVQLQRPLRGTRCMSVKADPRRERGEVSQRSLRKMRFDGKPCLSSTADIPG